MDNLLGLLRIRVKRGINLAVRDVRSSDPYVVIKMGKQTVFDHDTFSKDDKMGEAQFDIEPFIEAVRMKLEGLPDGTVITKIQPSRNNCLSEESTVIWKDARVVQDMCLRLKNVECGEVEIQLQWIELPGSKGFAKTIGIIDGASRSNPGSAGIGGIIRDWKDKFIKGFAKTIIIIDGTSKSNPGPADIGGIIRDLKDKFTTGFAKTIGSINGASRSNQKSVDIGHIIHD
ncbi:protein C2-DOMAIN ABA-RELATED 4 [Sesamum angolense]|uniref:Protein C2-DOMAIN ABA-RELATED 4 n=1 Tax=Sesamum angolense TaxID=2727404 RepID=A0AAE1WLU4_9LAMI|nr:protein C2-DOMAIN ABA-RELATED 4 [Sesamum angolense]